MANEKTLVLSKGKQVVGYRTQEVQVAVYDLAMLLNKQGSYHTVLLNSEDNLTGGLLNVIIKIGGKS
jgi:hypothetical protein